MHLVQGKGRFNDLTRLTEAIDNPADGNNQAMQRGVTFIRAVRLSAIRRIRGIRSIRK